MLYDGHCAFCSAQAARLGRLAGEKLELRPLQEEGLLARLGVSEAEARREMKLVEGKRIYGGAEAVVRALELARPGLRPLLRLYGLPLLRPATDRLYRWVASNRYRLPGRGGGCERACGLSGSEARQR